MRSGAFLSVIAAFLFSIALAIMPAAAIAAAPPSGRTIGMVATAYGPSLKDNYPYGPVDAFGKPLVAGDVAVDPRVVPLGTRLYISGYHSSYLPTGGFYAVARDTGGAIKGDRIDIFINRPDGQVSTFGIQHVTVTLLGAASGTAIAKAGTATAVATTARAASGAVEPLKGFKIVVDPGHGRDPRNGHYTGAMGVNGVSEDQNVLDIGQHLVALLRAQGATVVITRGIYDPGLPPVQGLIQRVALAAQAHADLFISIHQNDGSRTNHGVQTWYDTPQSLALAQDVQHALTSHTFLANLGLHHYGFYVLRNTTMPSVLVEGGFLSNPSEAARISSPAFHAKEASVLDRAILTYAQSHKPAA